MKSGREVFRHYAPGPDEDCPSPIVSFMNGLLTGLGEHHDSVHQVLSTLEHRTETLMTIVETLLQKVTDAESKLDAVKAVIDTHTFILTDLRAQLVAAQVAASPETIQNVINSLDAHVTALSASADAMVLTDPAPTPAAPPAAPPPAAPPAAPATTTSGTATDQGPTPPATPPAV